MALKVEADLSPIAAGQLRRARLVRVLRRQPVPSGRPRGLRHPGRGSAAPDGRPRLHDPGRARHGAVRAGRRRDGPHVAAELGGLAVLHRPVRQGDRRPRLVQHVPDHRQRDVRDGDGRRDRLGRQTPRTRPNPVIMTASPSPTPDIGEEPTPMTSATISTDIGDIEVDLFDESAPKATANFVKLAEQGSTTTSSSTGSSRASSPRAVTGSTARSRRSRAAGSGPAVPATSSRTRRSRATTSAARWRWPMRARTPTAASSSSATRT